MTYTLYPTTDEELRENRIMWVTNLLSNKFKQGYHRLAYKKYDEEETRYCCLGVLCVTAGVEMEPEFTDDELEDMSRSYRSYIFDGHCIAPSDDVMQSVAIPRGQMIDKLAGANDSGNSFHDIVFGPLSDIFPNDVIDEATRRVDVMI